MYAASLQRYYIPVVLAICTYALKLFILIYYEFLVYFKFAHYHTQAATSSYLQRRSLGKDILVSLSPPPLSDNFAKLIITETKVGARPQPSDEMTFEQKRSQERTKWYHTKNTNRQIVALHV